MKRYSAERKPYIIFNSSVEQSVRLKRNYTISARGGKSAVMLPSEWSMKDYGFIRSNSVLHRPAHAADEGDELYCGV